MLRRWSASMSKKNKLAALNQQIEEIYQLGQIVKDLAEEDYSLRKLQAETAKMMEDRAKNRIQCTEDLLLKLEEFIEKVEKDGKHKA